MQDQLEDDLAGAGFCIGERGNLSRNAARAAAQAWRDFVARHPGTVMYPSMHGYDDDPRGLWEIEEARDYFCRWAKFAGLNSSADAMAIPVAEEAFAVMAKCGAFEDVDPDTVRVAADH